MNHTINDHGWRLLSPEAREREYSPSSCIGGNYRPFVDAYFQRSEVARRSAAEHGGLWLVGQYGKAKSQRIDICVPSGASKSAMPLLVFIHGGYWQELSAEASLFSAAACVQQSVAFAAIDYTLAPEVSVSVMVEECRSALEWLAANASCLGFDASRIVVAGSSAGAHLAAMACLPDWRSSGQSSFCPAGAVLVSGIYELEPLIGTSINEALRLSVHEARAHSPGLLKPEDLKGFPKAVVCWGEVETDAFKDHSRVFASLLRQAGSSCDTFEIAQRNHFDVILDLAEPDAELGHRTFQLLGLP